MLGPWSIRLTDDGSATLHSDLFGEMLHSRSGARTEAEYKFVRPSGLVERPAPLRLLDICYGLGYNSAALLEAYWQKHPGAQIALIALELDPRIAREAAEQGWLSAWPLAQAVLTRLAQQGSVESPTCTAHLLAGDARTTIRSVPRGWADGVFLDPFSPEHCPMLWSVEFLRLVATTLHPQGVLVTYSAAAAVRRALIEAGFRVGPTPPVGRRSPGTIARLSGPVPPLSPQEVEHLATRAAIPYRDLDLTGDRESLRLRRNQEQAASNLEPTSQWRRRWQM